MTIRMTALTIFAAGVAFAAPALAAVTDTDGDGVFSFAELQAGYPDLTEETFLSIDADADGMVTPEELAAATDAGLLPKQDG